MIFDQCETNLMAIHNNYYRRFNTINPVKLPTTTNFHKRIVLNFLQGSVRCLIVTLITFVGRTSAHSDLFTR